MTLPQPSARQNAAAEQRAANDIAQQAVRDAQQAEAQGQQIEQAIQRAMEQSGVSPAVAGPEAPFPPGTIVIPSDGDGPAIRVSVDGSGIRLSQGTNSTTIPIQDVVPRGAVQISYALAATVIALCIGWPIARAIARYIDRRGRADSGSSALNAQLQQRFEAMERNIDTVAVEVERMSEAQRFTSKLLSERPVVVQSPEQSVAPAHMMRP